MGMVRMTEQAIRRIQGRPAGGVHGRPEVAEGGLSTQPWSTRVSAIRPPPQHHLDLYQQKLRTMEAELKALHDTGFGAGSRQ